MKKLLTLIGVTTLVFNSSIAGVILLKNNIQYDINKIKNATNNSEIDNNSLALIDDLLSQMDSNRNQPSFIKIIDMILPFIKNKSLSSDGIVNIIDRIIKRITASNPEIVDYLSYFKYGSFLSLTANELTNDWDQQGDYGSSPLVAMKNYIASEKGNIAHAKTAGNKGEWHYVEVRAGNWDWNDFYQYMAGTNLDYMMKILSGGSYIGNLINKHLSLGPWTYGFDQAGFLNDIATSFEKLPTTKEAWSYLIKAIVPIIKTKVLKSENPILGYDYLTWEKTSSKNLSLETLLREVKHLLSPDGRDDLVNIFASLLTESFGEDIIIDAGMLGYYTFPELLEVANKPPLSWIVGDSLKPTVLARSIVDSLINITNDLGIVDIVDDIFNKAEDAISENIKVDFKELSSDLNKIYANSDFETGLEQIIDIISNPETSEFSLKQVFKIWGVQLGKENFKDDSPLFIIKKWIDDPNSILNQILNVLRNVETEKNKMKECCI